MVEVDTLALVVPLVYRHSRGEREAYSKTKDVVDTLYDTQRFEAPYDLLLVGY
jgi:hypothetical protein